MKENKYCEECGDYRVELHHIVFKSRASYMSNIELNFKYLCGNCHRGNNGPHLDREKDLEYKMDLQKKLFEIFSGKKFWTEEEIKEKLNCTSVDVEKIVKKLRLYENGYNMVEIVVRLMGGILYAK